MIAKKKYFTAIFLLYVFVMILISPVLAAGDSSVITLSQAKELARNKARSMKNLAVTQDKLEVEARIAYDNYIGTDIQSNIDGYRTMLKDLQERIDNSNDPDEIASLQQRMAQLEQTISGLKGVLPSTQSTSNALRMQWRAKDNAYEDMDKIISDAEKELELRVEGMYFGLLNTQNSILLQEKNLELLGAQLQIERLKYDLGLSTKVDEKSIAVQYDNLYKMLGDLKNVRKIAVWQLNGLMGRELSSELAVVPEQIAPVLTTVSYEELLDKAIKNSLSIARKERDIVDYNADARKETNVKARKSIILSKEIAELELEDLTESYKVAVKALINDLETSYKTWENKTLATAKAKEAFRHDQAKYELGLISKLQYMGSELSYLQAANDELTAAQNWYLARKKIILAEQGVLVK